LPETQQDHDLQLFIIVKIVLKKASEYFELQEKIHGSKGKFGLLHRHL